jgi:hypothetical protein
MSFTNLPYECIELILDQLIDQGYSVSALNLMFSNKEMWNSFVLKKRINKLYIIINQQNWQGEKKV